MHRASSDPEVQTSHVPVTLSRRGFLHLGAAATAVLSLASAASMSGCRREESVRTGGYQPVSLTPREFGVLAAFCGSMLDSHGHPSADEVGVARRIDKELSFHIGDRLPDDVKSALLVLEHGPLLDGYFTRFTRLTAQTGDRYLRGVLASRLRFRRDALGGLRLLAAFFYYTDQRTWVDIGYTGPMAARKLPEASNALEAVS
jgi:hypothetical protein